MLRDRLNGLAAQEDREFRGAAICSSALGSPRNQKMTI
jgi:hypothetical protein